MEKFSSDNQKSGQADIAVEAPVMNEPAINAIASLFDVLIEIDQDIRLINKEKSNDSII